LSWTDYRGLGRLVFGGLYGLNLLTAPAPAGRPGFRDFKANEIRFKTAQKA